MIEKMSFLIMLNPIKANIGDRSIPNLWVGIISWKGRKMGSDILYMSLIMGWYVLCGIHDNRTLIIKAR